MAWRPRGVRRDTVVTAPRILRFGDAAVLLELDAVATVANARRARAVGRAVTELRGAGSPATGALGTPVAGAASVLVPFDPLVIDVTEAITLLAPLLAEDDHVPDVPPGPEHRIRVRYGGDDGPDLDAVAAETGLTRDEVIALHASAAYEVLFLGFAPGFAYLGELPERLVLPRLATPRTRVPAGSVGIAGPMTAVYPQASAGGWRLLGRTDERPFDPAADPPARLRPGDRVRFEPA